VGATVVVVEAEIVAGALVDVVEVVEVVSATVGAVERLDDAVVEVDESPELLQAPSAAIIVAAEAAVFHALLMATPPSGGC
jgi:hypothetical protein